MQPNELYIDLDAFSPARWREILELHERELDPRNAVIVSTVEDMRAREALAAAERAEFWRRVAARRLDVEDRLDRAADRALRKYWRAG